MGKAAEVTSERVDFDPPYHGAAYAIAYWQNDKYEATTKDKATKVEIVYYTKGGEHLRRVHGKVG